MLWVTAYWAPSWWRELIKTVVHLITTFLLSYPPQPLKSRATWSLLGEVCSVFSWLHSSNVTVMVTSGAQWPRGPVSSYARQWNENEVCWWHAWGRFQLFLGFWLEVELDCLFPELSGGRARDRVMEGTGAEQVLQNRQEGLVKAEVNA